MGELGVKNLAICNTFIMKQHCPTVHDEEQKRKTNKKKTTLKTNKFYIYDNVNCIVLHKLR